MAENHQFGDRSEKHIGTIHWNLELVIREALNLCPFDFTVVCGARGCEEQGMAYESGASKKRWPDSKHNVADKNGFEIDGRSDAVDLAPWINGDIPWQDEGSFYMLAGCVLAAAALMNIRVRSGCDWNGNGLSEDQTFRDLGHFELT